jgi:glycosyltransferase involved in cell wall biosynthesis
VSLEKENNMKIGFDIRPLQEARKSGVGEYVYELLAALFKIDNENEYFLFSNTRNIDKVDIPSHESARVTHKHFKFPNKFLNFRFKFLNSPKIDKLIGEKLDVFVFPNINFYSLSDGIKKILVIHDLSYEIYPEFYSAKGRLWHRAINARKFCKDADQIITVSQNTKKDVQTIFGISEDKVNTIYPGISNRFSNEIDTSGLEEKYNLPNKFILFLGTIEPRKNITSLIQAFENIKSEIPHDLVIAGAKGYRADKILSKLGERMHYIDYVDDADKPGLYKLADIFAFPSFYEGFGFPPLEAMATGTPVVASHTGSLSEVLGDSSLLINPYGPTEISEAIKNLANNPDLGQRLLENKKSYNWEDTAKEFLKSI